MYEISQVYFISNLVNLNSELYQLQENDINSLSEKIISSKKKELQMNLPMLYLNCHYYIIWKINVKEILNKDCFIKFIIKGFNSKRYKDSELVHYEHVLKYEEVLRLEGCGWIEYQLPKNVNEYYVQTSIEISGSINMQMDYVRYGHNEEEITYIPNICIGQNYTKASDIYSIDIIMNKVISELSPYHDVSYDNKNLCLDPNPLSRTEAEEIKKFLSQRPKESLMLKNNRYVIGNNTDGTIPTN
ncbi:hypothetical protein GLOIN_2v1727774 [Rhizophagus irregularis DAOM 181602=DAOM 197198]|nr:hypothetical protein GLOIN_2v1727774 [Rhizophagus irregularis DAOM 181602=DAOM 197198]